MAASKSKQHFKLGQNKSILIYLQKKYILFGFLKPWTKTVIFRQIRIEITTPIFVLTYSRIFNRNPQKFSLFPLLNISQLISFQYFSRRHLM